MLDPGHFGSYYNASPTVSGYYESNMTWSLAAKLKSALEDYGFEVLLTRYSKDEDVELTERGRRGQAATCSYPFTQTRRQTILRTRRGSYTFLPIRRPILMSALQR